MPQRKTSSMGLEYRNGKPCFYTKHRVGKTVVSRYIGGGLVAAMAALDAEQRAMERQDASIRRQQVRQADRLVREATAPIRALVADLLDQAGFYQHKRQWRKRKMADELSRVELDQLLKRCNLPGASESDITELRRVLRQYPERWKSTTNGLARACTHLIEFMPAVALVRETTRAAADRVRADLGYADAPALEQLLIDAVVLAYVRLMLAEQDYTNTMHDSPSLDLATYFDRHLTAAHGRYLRSVEALARVRRLAVPALIQNIAAQQVVAIRN